MLKTFNEHKSIPKLIAHRGLFNDECIENGLKAFENAINHHLAFELDVHLTKDDELVVSHDSDLFRVTNKHGIIEQLTFKEIKDNYHLLDGEEIPSLKEVLTLNNEQVPIIVELKTYNNNALKLVKRVKEELKDISDSSKIVIISFDVDALKMMDNRFKRQLLIDRNESWKWEYVRLFDGADIEQGIVSCDEAISYRKQGKTINVWTIETLEQLDNVLPFVDMVTFQKIDVKSARDAMHNGD